MATNGNNPNEAYWESQHHQQQQLNHHHLQQQHQQQFMNAPPEGPPLPAASNSFFHPNAPGDHHPHLQHHASVHGMNYGHPSQLPPPPGDNNFTVLSDAYGNFYKVYHQPNNSVANEDVNPPGGKCEYELFSSNNNFMRPAPGFGFLFHTPQQQQQPQQTQSLPAVQNEASRPEPTTSSGSSSGTSMLINQLVGNWAPTISGTYSPFGGGGPSLLAEGLPRSSESSFVPPSAAAVAAPAPPPPQTPPKQPSPVHQPKVPEVPLSEASPVEPQLPQAPPPPAEPPQLANNPIAAPTPAVATNNYNKMNDEKSAKLNANVKKQRIVAEVKPMRMSYSDVLSKNVVPPQANPTSGSSAPTSVNAVGGTKTTGSGHSSNGYGTKSSGKTDKGQTKKSVQPADKKVERGGAINGQQKKPMQPTGTTQSHLDGTKSNPVQNGLDKGSSSAKKLDKSTTKIAKNRNASGSGDTSGGKKNRPRNFNDAYTVQDVQGPTKELQPEPQDEDLDDDEDEEDNSEEYEDDSPAPASSSQQPNFLYNVKKNHNPNDTHIEKISGGGGKSSLSGGYKRAGRSAGRTKPDKPSSSSSATAAGSSTSGNKRSARPRKNQKYAFVQKLLNAWIEYTVIVLLWLWSLVSDVVYLSLRLCWDYLVAGYQYCEQRVMNLRQEFQQNQPGTWFKGVWKSFDNRFAKESKWAFWRGKRKANAATSNEDNSTTTRNYYKDGRLPSTADEAMSSLLNCKGKDAYSILGVSPDCSQEQIRKHYKKIAVLVHPDKNKQPGAEEAFKVLQRSFELIGEPENRKAYDQSLAEALNAEKAWSEINDLLTQLHTKISEAANTIRCSSCCLRHPRKPTGRPHYAARECNSCKIRHSAREGDIWAETSFFGLRWKYLAMMEGNVYDITEWANCQKGALSHLQPNSHIVQYRIVLGGNSQNQQQQQQQQQQNLQREQQQTHQNGSGGHHHHHHQGDKDGSNRSRKDGPTSEPNLDDFLNNIYGGQNQQQQQQAQGGSRRRHRRN